MVDETLFDERPGFPALRTCAQHGDQINPARPYGRVTADLFKALPPEHLTHTRHMLDADKLIVVAQIPFAKRGSSDSQLAVLGESIHKERKIVWIEGDVGVQIADDVILQFAQSLLAGANGYRFPGEISFAALGHAHQFNPRVIRGVFPDDVIGAVCRAIAHDHPSEGWHSLRNDRFEGQLNILGLIPRRSNQNVARQGLHDKMNDLKSRGSERFAALALRSSW